MSLPRSLAVIAATVVGIATVQVVLTPIVLETAAAVTHRSGIVALAHNGWVLAIHGHVWNSQPGECWTRYPDYDPPVPVREVELWDVHALITLEGELWRNSPEGCESCGTWPHGPASTNGRPR